MCADSSAEVQKKLRASYAREYTREKDGLRMLQKRSGFTLTQSIRNDRMALIIAFFYLNMPTNEVSIFAVIAREAEH
jgi:hypothetical protein